MSWGSRFCRSVVLMALGLLPGAALAAALDACWTDEVRGSVIDVDGNGVLQGAWSLPASGLPRRMQQASGALTLLVPGYDVTLARRLCAQASGEKHPARVLFGGRERQLAEQRAPAWEWLLVSTDAIAASLLGGDVQGIFVGGGKVVVGQGLSQSDITDPARMAAWLMDGPLARREPVVLFVEAAQQQRFFDFFSNNPLPGVFLSFEDSEVVKDGLNRHASITEFGPEGLSAYFCR